MVSFSVLFMSQCLSSETGRDTSALKHAKGRNSDIVLVPQPSDSPRDPLNWPQWKKELLLVIISIDTAVVGAWGKLQLCSLDKFGFRQLSIYKLAAAHWKHGRCP